MSATNEQRIDPALYSSAGFAKTLGFKSLKQAANILGKPTNTLNNWHRDSLPLFEAALIGAKVLLDRKKSQIVD